MKKTLLFSLIGLLFSSYLHAANAIGEQRGVTFFYLDGGGQDFPWVLENQYNPQVREKIDALLTEYRAAGVNWIRLLIASDHFYKEKKNLIEPIPNNSMIQYVNDFMAITRSGPNAGKFTIELVLVPKTENFQFDLTNFESYENWYREWFNNLDFSNLGMVMLGGDLAPCSRSGHCEGDQGVYSYFDNHGKWIKHMWNWKEAEFPNLNASYEVAFEGGLPNNDLVRRMVRWINNNTPSLPAISAALYTNLAPGSSWVDYANATAQFLDTYHSETTKLLWIDEIGRSIGQGWTEADQLAYFQGVLGASVCWKQNKYPTFAWVAGNDYPYDGKQVFGLVKEFNGKTPVMRQSWSVINQYFNLQKCP